ncbi:mannose-6-phosphate isomerase, type 1 [Clostridium cadaveris]|uniref:Phosphohexomutase n=1 Tax=Clostridium cadaveris TaxID=1529 RepID=A0A1I2JHP0_9CLOT|nr:type I phosphomannose isomerase catalytic subunit [Clostridium cadaveris]MDM8312096.1 class I mannose-6-phosphate isomerase [Clostridium cadaveris]SFF54385.1 mannose-6-phosphate isomerase, type 1 [Clostridium cadaveris]
MYAIRFENLYYPKIWGGRSMEAFRVDLPQGNIGESWDVACHKNGMSIVTNGEYKGMALDKLIEKLGDKLLGTKITKDRFPLLLKVINAKDKLSLQVHPDDEYGLQYENDLGKTEAWYVMDVEEGANLIVGTKDCTKEKFIDAIKNGTFDECVNKVYVKKGEVYFVKSGLVHGIGEGVTVVEIQQNSDTTYRVYDYNRGRELQIEKALDVIDFSLKGKKSEGIKISYNGYEKVYYCLNPYFCLEKYTISETMMEESDEERFFILTCVDGCGTLEYADGNEKIKKGDSIFIPASLGQYRITGQLELLKSYVPDVKKVEKEILDIIEK